MPVAEVVPAAPPWDRRRDRRAALLLFLVVWAVYLATATYTVDQVNDNRSTTAAAWSLGTRGTLAMPEGWDATKVPWSGEGVDGRVYSGRFPGGIVWAAPFHAAAELILQRGDPGHPWLLDYAPSGVAAATAAALGVAVTFLLFRRLADRRLAVVAALVLAFCTGTWSVSADQMWNHSLTHLTLSLGVLAAAAGKDGRAGLAFAGAVVSRPQTAVVPLVVGIWNGVVARSPRRVLVLGVCSFLGVVAMAVYSQAIFGSWLPVAGYSSDRIGDVATVPTSAFAERVFLGLFDPLRGGIVYAPFLFFLLPFIRHGWRASPQWARAAAVSGVVYYLVQMRANGYDGGHQFFGARLSLETLVLAAPLLLRTWQVKVSREWLWRRVTLAAIATAFVMHAVGATILSVPEDVTTGWREALIELCEDQPGLQGCR